MRIVAPFDGVTGIRSVNVGDYVKDGAELVMLEDLGALWVDFRLPERYLSRLKEGQSVQVSLDAMPGKAYQAKVVALDAQLDTNGRALLVRASLANEDGRLRGGMFARVRTVFSTRDQALVVPEEALVPVGDDQIVFKVVDGERGKVARRTSVRIGARLPGKVEIVEGLADGDVVVVAGQARLVRGDNLPVRVVDLERQGAGAPGRGGQPPGAGRPGGAPPAGAAGGGSAGGAGGRPS
jgi:membrane fusion protein (multidrug efflux system)